MVPNPRLWVPQQKLTISSNGNIVYKVTSTCMHCVQLQLTLEDSNTEIPGAETLLDLVIFQVKSNTNLSLRGGLAKRENPKIFPRVIHALKIYWLNSNERKLIKQD